MNLNPWVRTDSPNGEPDWPAVRPFIEIWRDSSPKVLLVSKQMASYAPGVQSGVFRHTDFLGQLYNTPGRHFVIIRWVDVDSVPRQAVGSFELTAGGNQAGTILSMAEVSRPDARYLLTATDAGTISRRKNPR